MREGGGEREGGVGEGEKSIVYSVQIHCTYIVYTM